MKDSTELIQDLLLKTGACGRLSLPKEQTESFVFEISGEYFEKGTKPFHLFLEQAASCEEILKNLKKAMVTIPFDQDGFKLKKSRIFFRDNLNTKLNIDDRPIRALLELQF